MLLYEELSKKILEAYFNVFKHLTTGLLESVYEKALCIEFDEMGIPYERQKRLQITYKGSIIGEFVSDLVVDNKIILELKSIPQLTPANTAQLINYLKITGMPVGYLLNFGEGRDYKRILNKESGLVRESPWKSDAIKKVRESPMQQKKSVKSDAIKKVRLVRCKKFSVKSDAKVDAKYGLCNYSGRR